MKQLTDLFHKCFYNGLTFDCNSSKGYVCIYKIDDCGQVKIVTYGLFTELELNRMQQEVDAFIESHYVKENVV